MSKVQELREKLDAAKCERQFAGEEVARLQEEYNAAIGEESGIRVGSIVKSNNQRFIVTHISGFSGRCSLTGKKQLKTGGWAIHEKYIGLFGISVELDSTDVASVPSTSDAA
jgi:hypothetical protein